MRAGQDFIYEEEEEEEEDFIYGFSGFSLHGVDPSLIYTYNIYTRPISPHHSPLLLYSSGS
jgi:hypothetical protein